MRAFADQIRWLIYPLEMADFAAGIGLAFFSLIGAVFWMAMAAPLPA